MTDHREQTFNLSAKRSALLEALLEEEGIDSSDDQYIPRRNTSKPCLLSFAQQRLWFLDQLEPGSSTYNISSAFHLHGALNIKALGQSIGEIVKRHESLRTTFYSVDGQPFQVIKDDLSIKLAVIDLSRLQETARQDEIHRLADEEASRPFNLTQGPLFRVTLLKTDEEDYVLLLTIHHIISDGWSMGILFRELSILYDAFSRGHPYHLPELPIQYPDFSVWQQQWLQSKELETQLSYWKQQLDDAPFVLELPADRPRPPMQTYRGDRKSVRLSKALTAQLRKLSNDEGTTLFMTVLAAFQTLLYRYTGQKKILVGSPIASRNRTEMEGLIGFFVNTLVIKTDISGELSFRELLGRVREAALEAYAHQDLPFEKLVEELQPERDLSRSPVFQVMFVLQNAPRNPLELSGLEVVPLDNKNDASMFDLTLFLWEVDDGIEGSIAYCTDLFDSARIALMAGHYLTLLEGIIANPDQLISKLPLLTCREQHQLLVNWNDTRSDYPKNRRIHELFEEQVAQIPGSIAVVFGDETLTYLELNRRANQLAHYLKGAGVGSDVFVGICVERSIEMMVALLGVLKAGGAYVPLDPLFPAERLALMLEDAQVAVLLTQESLISSLPEAHGTVVCMDKDWESVVAQQPERDPLSEGKAEHLAYVIYTSGSTGRPKGVQISHRALANFLFSMKKEPGLSDRDVLLAVTTLSFDIAMLELLLPLVVGARVAIMTSEEASDGKRLLSKLTECCTTVMQATPATWQLLLAVGWQGDKHLKILCGGEPLPRDLANQLVERCHSLWNMYGPTETTIWSTVNKIEDKDGPVLIGFPIANTQIYILDQHLQAVPVGVPGELHIGGDGLARGYLNRPELTAERFIDNPINDVPGSRLYKTGDLAKYLPDGNIEVLGRLDFQVKVRGFRIELGDIESALEQHPAVQQAVVTAREDIPGDKQLVAYIVADDHQRIPVNTLRSFLKKKIPAYMVPSLFEMITTLPLTPNGKIDRRALPAPHKVRQESAETLVAPRDDLELQLTKIWEKVLDIKRVGMKDNFFDLGGHSLLAVRLFAQIEKIFGKDIPLATLFQAPTVEQLAGLLRQENWSSPWSSLVPMQPSGSRPPFFCTHGCGGIVFHMQGLVRHLFPQQPFYGLKAQGLEKGQTPHTRIEDMAALYIKEIQTIQPDGPYFIGSSGGGGAIGLELAKQLKAHGQTVALLILFNPATPYLNLSHFNFIRGLYGGSLKYFFHRLVDFLHNRPLLPYVKYTFFNRVLVNWRRFQKFVPMNIQREQRFRDVFRDALSKYTPQHVYPGRITCFLYEKSPYNPKDRVRDWYDVAGGGLDIRIVPGTFEGMWREPHVRILAEQLKASLEEAQTNSEGSIDTKN